MEEPKEPIVAPCTTWCRADVRQDILIWAIWQFGWALHLKQEPQYVRVFGRCFATATAPCSLMHRSANLRLVLQCSLMADQTESLWSCVGGLVCNCSDAFAFVCPRWGTPNRQMQIGARFILSCSITLKHCRNGENSGQILEGTFIFCRGQPRTCCRWCRFPWWTTQEESFRCDVGMVNLLRSYATLHTLRIAIWRSCWLPQQSDWSSAQNSAPRNTLQHI